MVAQRWQAAFCVGTPLGPETRLPMPSYEREVAVRQDPNYLPDSDSNNKNISDDNDETVHAESIPMIEQGDEKKQPKNMQVCHKKISQSVGNRRRIYNLKLSIIKV